MAQSILDRIREPQASPGNYIVVVYARGGVGKCLGRGTPVMLFDGTISLVEDIRIGDVLMGDDSTPRNVLSISHGEDDLYKILPVKGKPWVCNKAHVLTVIGTGTNVIRDVSLESLIAEPYALDRKRQHWKLMRARVNFPPRAVPVDPYFVGLWLGDGTNTSGSVRVDNPDEQIAVHVANVARQWGLELRIGRDKRNDLPRLTVVGVKGKANPLAQALRLCRTESGDKCIPDLYLHNSESVRLELLAGLLDTDGYLSHGTYEIISKNMGAQIAQLGRTLGFAVAVRDANVRLRGRVAPRTYTYQRLMISGDTDRIPCRIPRKQATARRQIKRSFVTGFTAEPIGRGEYFGFTLDGNGRFLLGDCTITHNTTLLGTIPGRGLVIDIPDYEGGDMVLLDKKKRISIAPAETWEELNTLYMTLKKNDGVIKGVKYDWVAIDSVTGAQQLARKKVLREREEITAKAYQIQLRDWGGIGQLMGELFEKYRLLKMPVYFTAQEKAKRDESLEDGEVSRLMIPNISPMALDQLIPHPILIGRLYMHEDDEGNWQRYFRVGPHANFITKARCVPGRPLPNIIEKPNLGKIVAWMSGKPDAKKPRAAPEDTVDLGGDDED